jgi:predicted lipoprotein
MKRGLTWVVSIAVVTGVCWLFPLFHIVPLKQAAAQKANATFNPTQFAESFWSDSLLPAAANATSAEQLVKVIQTDPAAAKKSFARSVGLGESYFYFLGGNGKVLSVSEDEILLSVTGGTNAEIALQAGLVFGNALRDGTGLLNVSDYPNSQDFNSIAEALNQLVETRVQPKLRKLAKPGATISFAGCAEVGDESADLKPLKVVPIHVEAK